MRQRRSRRRSRFGKTPGTTKEWIYASVLDSATGRANTAIGIGCGNLWASYILNPSDMESIFDEPTLLRTIFRYSVAPVATPGVLETDTFHCGFIRSNLNAPAGTIATALLPAVPHPLYNADEDWILHTSFGVVSGYSKWTGADANLNGVGEIDNRSRRRFQDGSGLLFVMWFDSSSPGQIINAWFGSRFLFMNR